MRTGDTYFCAFIGRLFVHNAGMPERADRSIDGVLDKSLGPAPRRVRIRGDADSIGHAPTHPVFDAFREICRNGEFVAPPVSFDFINEVGQETGNEGILRIGIDIAVTSRRSDIS